MNIGKTLYVTDRQTWRAWLAENYDKEKEIWLVYPKKASGKPRILYNDAVEEALCFGWIDSTAKRIDDYSYAQRFSPRNPKSPYSEANKVRLRKLVKEGMVIPSVKVAIQDILNEDFVMPSDILKPLKPIRWCGRISKSFHFNTRESASLTLRVHATAQRNLKNVSITSSN